MGSSSNKQRYNKGLAYERGSGVTLERDEVKELNIKMNNLSASDDWFQNVSKERRNSVISEKDLAKMVEGFGGGWELIGAELNVSSIAIDRIKDEHRTVVNQILNMLIKWHQKEASKATFDTLVKALRACNDTSKIDWDIIRRVVRG